MANADTNTNHYLDSHPNADIYYSDMAASLVDINFSELESTACLVLMQCCDESPSDWPYPKQHQPTHSCPHWPFCFSKSRSEHTRRNALILTSKHEVKQERNTVGRTLEEILAQEDPHMIADARRLAAEIMLEIDQAECASLDRDAAEESLIQQKATDSN